MKIVFTGPESTGKTTLSNWLSQLSGFPLVPEMARIYFNDFNHDYDVSHVREIGLLQDLEETLINNHHPNIICDTDLLTILIWLKVKYKISDDHLFEKWLNSPVDIYFLCLPDIPWEEDPLRENPNDREHLLTIYQLYLKKYQKPYIEVSGPLSYRKEIITSKIFELTGINL